MIQQVCVALLQLVLLDRYRMFSHEVFPVRGETWSRQIEPKRIDWLWQTFDDQCDGLSRQPTGPAGLKGPVAPTVSTLVQGLRMVFNLERDSAHGMRANERSDVRQQLGELFSDKQVVASIDELRFTFLLKIGERKLAER